MVNFLLLVFLVKSGSQQIGSFIQSSCLDTAEMVPAAPDVKSRKDHGRSRFRALDVIRALPACCIALRDVQKAGKPGSRKRHRS
ncbi:MAG: hypothetical protein H5U17_12485 [Defluviimonas sp.]|nr:hypothetical protein [Defluviimonas sp.]